MLGVRAIGTIALHRDFRWDEPQPLKEWQFLRTARPKDPSDARIVTHHSVHERSAHALTTMGSIDHDHREIPVGMVVANGTSEADDLCSYNRDNRALRS